MNQRMSAAGAVQAHVEETIQGLLDSLPTVDHLSAEERRALIARYTAVLEGNFIYWMTATQLAVATEEAKSIIHDNLLEEVRDNHPGMLRRFAIAANAVPTDTDGRAVDRDLQAVRQFLARLEGLRMLAMMACFEGFIARFMPYLADLARSRKSTEQEYTVVHGTCDIAHTEALFRAFEVELRRSGDTPEPMRNLTEGVDLLRNLLQTVIAPVSTRTR